MKGAIAQSHTDLNRKLGRSLVGRLHGTSLQGIGRNHKSNGYQAVLCQAAVVGKTTVTVVPTFTSLARSMRPRCKSTQRLTIASPNPVP